MTLEQFKREWVKHFAGDVSAEDIGKYILCHGAAWNFIWHAFSWELVPEEAYLVDEAARRAFDETDKDGAVAIDPFEDNAKSVPLPDELHNAKAIEELTEYYVVGQDLAWTYIQTHEGGLGPYFCRRRTDSAANYDKAVRWQVWKQRQYQNSQKARKQKQRIIGAGLGAAALAALTTVYARIYHKK